MPKRLKLIVCIHVDSPNFNAQSGCSVYTLYNNIFVLYIQISFVINSNKSSTPAVMLSTTLYFSLLST